jgi:NACalpha-BTF3-like transcription factor
MTANIRKFEEIDTDNTFNMDPADIKLIVDKTKKSIVKSFYIPIEQKEIGIVNTDTNKIEIVVKVNMILDLKDMHKDDLELVYEEANITEQFKKYYPCNYLYLLGDHTVVQ